MSVFQFDTPEFNPNNKMPMLDTAMMMATESREKGVPREINPSNECISKQGSLKTIIMYTFYKKPMASRYANLKTPGLPEGSKFNTAVEEVMRRFKNCSRELPINHINGVIKDYMGETSIGGYSLAWRQKVLGAARKGYCRIWKFKIDGKGSVNRYESASFTSRRAAKICRASYGSRPT